MRKVAYKRPLFVHAHKLISFRFELFFFFMVFLKASLEEHDFF